MPMRKLSTRCMDELEKKKEEALEVVRSPRTQTLDILRQFARVYHAEPALRVELRGYVLN